MRATCEFSEAKGSSSLPPIKVKIYKTRNDITIKISDLGGGIPRVSSGKVFNYMWVTFIPLNNYSIKMFSQVLNCSKSGHL